MGSEHKPEDSPKPSRVEPQIPPCWIGPPSAARESYCCGPLHICMPHTTKLGDALRRCLEVTAQGVFPGLRGQQGPYSRYFLSFFIKTNRPIQNHPPLLFLVTPEAYGSSWARDSNLSHSWDLRWQHCILDPVPHSRNSRAPLFILAKCHEDQNCAKF